MPRHRVTLTVALKIPDNEARSALEALRVKMGLAESVRDLSRDELWELELEAGSAEEAEEVVARLVETTNIFANPNKHRVSIERGWEGAGAAALAASEVAILVSDREGGVGASVAAAVRRLGVSALLGARRWTRWRVRLASPASATDPGLLALIQKVGLVTGRRDGLLCNPHSQVAKAILAGRQEMVLSA